MRHIRRCVIGTDVDGQSYTQFDNDDEGSFPRDAQRACSKLAIKEWKK
jgi:hypothetical protein